MCLLHMTIRGSTLFPFRRKQLMRPIVLNLSRNRRSGGFTLGTIGIKSPSFLMKATSSGRIGSLAASSQSVTLDICLLVASGLALSFEWSSTNLSVQCCE